MFLGAKVQLFFNSHNPNTMSFFVPCVWYVIFFACLNLIESLFQIVDNIVDVLCTNAQTNGCWCNVLFSQFLR